MRVHACVTLVLIPQWMKGEIDPDTGTNWHSWNRKQLTKVGGSYRC